MYQHSRKLLLLAVAVAAVACGSDAAVVVPVSKIVTFKGTMNSAQENNAANTSTATGTFTATLDTSTNVFTYDVTFSGLASNVTSGHIHGPAAAGVNSGTTINFATLPSATVTLGATSGTAHGVTTLNAANAITATVSGDSLKKLLFAGLTYANIHSTGFGGGEIRGQITKQ